MIKSVKKIFRLLCVICVAMIAITSIGSAAWYFFASVEETQNATQIGDPLRPNHTFGESEDTILREMEYYDVYFLSQNVQDIKKNFLIEDGMIDGKINYRFKDLSKGLYYEQNYVSEGDLRFGKWGEGSLSPYYKKIENVETVTNVALDEIGKPSCQLVDANSDVNNPSKRYVLQFSSWSADPYDIYPRESYFGMNSEYIQVYGTYPYHDFEIAYFNTLLSYYDSRSIYIDGTKSLFFYPIYTIGKGYYVHRNLGNGQSPNNLRDCLSIQTSDTTEEFFTFDEKYTNLMKEKGFVTEPDNTSDDQTRYLAYRYFDFVVDNSEKNLKDRGYITNQIDRVNGSWSGDRARFQRTINNDTSDVYINDEAGRFNVYVFVKERYKKNTYTTPSVSSMNADFTSEELQKIADILREQSINVHTFWGIDVQSIRDTSHRCCDTRDYFVVLEKRYEPRIIGGRTGAYDYNNPESIRRYLVQHGTEITGDGKNCYDYRGAIFDCEDESFKYIDFASNVSFSTRKMKIPSYYFAIQLSRAKVVAYDQNILDETKTDAELKYKRPVYKYSVEQEDGTSIIMEEPYQSSSLLIKMYQKNEDNTVDPNTAISLELEDYKKKYEKYGGNSSKWSQEDKNEFVYKDVYRVQITKADPVADPTFYELGEYIIKGQNGDEGFKDWETLLTSFNLVRPKESGIYNIFAHLTFQPNPNDEVQFSAVPKSVDIWVYRQHNIFVNIFDPEDFPGEKPVQFDGTYYKDVDLERYSFRCESYYHMETDFMYEKDGTSYKRYVRKNGLSPLSGLTAQKGAYDIYSILQYYDGKGKCLQDLTTGRYITLENCKTNPFIIVENYYLLVVDKPQKVKGVVE